MIEKRPVVKPQTIKYFKGLDVQSWGIVIMIVMIVWLVSKDFFLNPWWLAGIYYLGLFGIGMLAKSMVQSYKDNMPRGWLRALLKWVITPHRLQVTNDSTAKPLYVKIRKSK